MMLQNRYYTSGLTIGKTQDIQRTQVDELFRILKDGVELPETEPGKSLMSAIGTIIVHQALPGPDVATKLYPHQKKALTFLLDREHEKPLQDGQFSSLWHSTVDQMTGRRRWINVVTEEESHERPEEAKGAILADDVCQIFCLAFLTVIITLFTNCDFLIEQMGLGKTITCVSLIAATLQTARYFAAQPLKSPQQMSKKTRYPDASHFAGSVFGMPDPPTSSKDDQVKKANREQEKAKIEYVRACRIKARSRATLIICPLSTVANWEEQFREHWRGEVTVVGGNGIAATTAAAAAGSSTNMANMPDSMSVELSTASQASTSTSISTAHAPAKSEKSRVRGCTPLRVYVYHGNARRPNTEFLADFDAVITTYATLASEFSKQNRTARSQGEDGDGGSSDGGIDRGKLGGDTDVETVELQTSGMSLESTKPATKKTGGTKRKKPMMAVSNTEVPSPLQSIHWFRVVLDEAQYALLSL